MGGSWWVVHGGLFMEVVHGGWFMGVVHGGWFMMEWFMGIRKASFEGSNQHVNCGGGGGGLYALSYEHL